LNEFEQGELVTYLNLVNDVELPEFNVIKESLLNYLQRSGIAYNEHLENRTIEIFEQQADQILEVARNFDIIHSINSTSSAIIRPNRVGVAERTFPFTIAELGPSRIRFYLLVNNKETLAIVNIHFRRRVVSSRSIFSLLTRNSPRGQE
jgi:hypothetical protein